MKQPIEDFDFSTDGPLENPTYDRLGVNLFAENLATCIESMHSSSGIVIGLYGSWGSGKSTVLNFVKHHLRVRNQANVCSSADSPSTGLVRTIDFNPWWFSEDEDLVRRFIWSLIAEVDRQPGKGDMLVAGLKQFMAAAETLPAVGDYAKPINFLIRTYGKQPIDFYESKGKLENLLRNQADRFVVFLDDVDRLAPREVCQVLRLVKSVADFPNVTYVMALDPIVVADAIQRELHCPDGSKYIDKIVQVAFTLPLPDDVALRKMLADDLIKEVLIPQDVIESPRYQSLYEKGLTAFIKTPRDICRLVNALRLTYPMVEGTVDVVDFVGIEAVRLFRPRDYELIRSSKAQFVGPSVSIASQIASSPHPENSALFKFHGDWISRDSDARVWAQSFYSSLFPALGAFWNQPVPRNWEADAVANQRICDADSFDRYFRLQIVAGALSNPILQSLIEQSPSGEDFKAGLLMLASERRPDGAPRILEFVSKLPILMAEKSNQQYLSPVVSRLLSCGEALCQAWSSVTPDGINPNGWTQRDLLIQLWLHIDSILRLLQRDELTETLLQVIEASEELTLALMVVSDMQANQKKKVGHNPTNQVERVDGVGAAEGAAESSQFAGTPNTQDNPVNDDWFERVKAAMLARMGRAVAAKEIESSQFELIILDRWMQLDSDAARAWISEQIKDAHRLIRIIRKALHRLYSMDMKMSIPVVDPHTLEDFFDTESVEGQLKEVSIELGFTADDVVVAKAYLSGLESRRKGRDPTLDASLAVEIIR